MRTQTGAAIVEPTIGNCSLVKLIHGLPVGRSQAKVKSFTNRGVTKRAVF